VLSLPNATPSGLEDRCPACDQPIANQRLKEIEARQRSADERRTKEIEAQLTQRFELRVATMEKEAAAAIAATEVAATAAAAVAREDGRKEAEAEAVATVQAERTARAAADQALKDQAAMFDATVAARLAEVHKGFDVEKAAASAALDKEMAARAAADKALEDQTAQLEANVAGRVEEIRTALEGAHAEETAAFQAKAFEEKTKLIKEVDDLKRSLEKQSNAELGEGAEVVVFDALRAAFPDDDIRRVKKGTEGADIIHKIRDKGRTCGSIVYDSKNRIAWRNAYVAQLRKDQLAAKAEHAVLATRVFPTKTRQLTVMDGVILANPARVVALIEVLRTQTILIAGLRLSEEAREEKMAALYDFVTSDRFRQLFNRMDSAEEAILELDVKEVKAHKTTWENRAQLVRNSQQARATLVSEIAQIVQTPNIVELRQAT
jgi:hypothetical protein